MNTIKLYEEFISSQSKKSDQLNESPLINDALMALTTHPELGPTEIVSHLTQMIKHMAIKKLGAGHPAVIKLEDAHKTLNSHMAKKMGRVAPILVSKI
jgi:hypothetical protein